MDQSTPTLTNEHYMTREFLQNQIAALAESIEKKDAYITRLQDENSEKNKLAYTLRAEQTNFRNTVQEYLIENYDELELHADAIAEILDIQLTREVTYDVTITARVTVAVPVGEDAEEILNDNLYVDANYGDIQVDSYEIYNMDEI